MFIWYFYVFKIQCHDWFIHLQIIDEVVIVLGGRVRPITSIMPSQITESAKVHKAVNEIDKFR